MKLQNPNRKATVTEGKDNNGASLNRWTVKVGSVSVKIYGITNKGEPAFMVCVYANGKRKQESRVAFKDALSRAEELAGYIDRGQPQNVALSGEAGLVYARAERALQPLGVAVDTAALQLAELQARLGGRSLAEAVEYFAARHPVGLSSKTVSEVVAEFIAARTADGCGRLHLQDLAVRLGAFARDFQLPISAVTTQALSDWLRGLKCSARSRNNYRNAIRNLFGFVVAQKLVAADAIDWDGSNGVSKAKVESEPIEIFTAAEIVKLIAAARYEGVNDYRIDRRYADEQALLPLLVLGAFAGLRTSEVCAQRWEDINLERGFIRVTKAKGNTPSRRLVPISEGLRKWLAVCPKNGARVMACAKPDTAIPRLAKRAGVAWKHNALRHSFISYRLAEIQNVAQVAIEAGNSPKMIHQHYRELVSPQDSKAWLAIVPEAPAPSA